MQKRMIGVAVGYEKKKGGQQGRMEPPYSLQEEEGEQYVDKWKTREIKYHNDGEKSTLEGTMIVTMPARGKT